MTDGCSGGGGGGHHSPVTLSYYYVAIMPTRVLSHTSTLSKFSKLSTRSVRSRAVVSFLHLNATHHAASSSSCMLLSVLLCTRSMAIRSPPDQCLAREPGAPPPVYYVPRSLFSSWARLACLVTNTVESSLASARGKTGLGPLSHLQAAAGLVFRDRRAINHKVMGGSRWPLSKKKTLANSLSPILLTLLPELSKMPNFPPSGSSGCQYRHLGRRIPQKRSSRSILHSV